MHTENSKTYLMRYEPAKHDGVANWRNHEFTYFVETAANIEGEYFYAADLEADNKLKRSTLIELTRSSRSLARRTGHAKNPSNQLTLTSADQTG